MELKSIAMRAFILLLALGVAAPAAVSRHFQKIVGGSVTTIEQYPYGTALLYTWGGVTFTQACGGTILNSRAVLSAAHCFFDEASVRTWRIRVGSTWGNSGGTVHNINRIIIHPNYDDSTLNDDVAILHATTAFSFSNSVAVGRIAGTNYNVGDNQAVWAIGWGRIYDGGPSSEQLRHVQVWTVNQEECVRRYATEGDVITDSMLCSGWIDVGGRDQCHGDSGGPLIHNGVVVGVCSWGRGCADSFFPGVNVRVSRFTTWIQANA